MRRVALILAFAASVTAPGSAVYAQAAKQSQDTPPKPQPSRVHLGSTSVTVVDEHDTVDDVITRLRKAKPPADKQEQTKSASATQTTTVPDKSNKAREDGRAELRSQRTVEAERAEGERSKEERRERAAASRLHGARKQRR
jgi:uncharacterized iron-regulated membrane protein